ncbi:hypothetical protein CB0940_00009 [Cercospora beticola]|uniref:SnoaL-like domain-containing protein n=1 Tax=Cercospora beticola TaxID=122368 RepID=A0A2G5IBY1_CERBT|nr:hypothetical protein CB0940_00009 [Cercospora beticola]PIB01983.1 hypothetical protein CB0940_00009 [Cercospora beticola]WPA95410.1 hypothetical protein RHO25_000009 [Cercospora beticola]
MAASNSLEAKYVAYINAINARPFPGLKEHMHSTVTLNDKSMPLAEFEKLLSTDIDAAPDMRFQLAMLLVDESKQQVGCRIEFRCTPLQKEFMGHRVHGKIKCMEHMFYQYRDGKIAEVWWMPGEFVGISPNASATKL